MGYSLFDHTADVGIEATGNDLGEACANAAEGLSEIIAGQPIGHQTGQHIKFRLEAPDEESAVVAFLSELLWLLESDGLMWSVGGVTLTAGGPGWIIEADGNAVTYDPSKHGQGVEVKAITYHGLSIDRSAEVKIRVVVDI